MSLFGRVAVLTLIICFFSLALGFADIIAPAKADAQDNSGISASIELNKTTVKIGKELKVKALITQNGEKLKGVEVRFDITDSNGSIVNSITAVTNNRGKAKDPAVYAQYSKVKKILELPLVYQNIYNGMAEG